MTTLDLSKVDEIGKALWAAGRQLDHDTAGLPEEITVGHLYCARCQRDQRVRALVRYSAAKAIKRESLLHASGQLPKFLEASCLHCQAVFAIVACVGPAGPEVIVLPQVGGGLATSHTLPAVAYYLDQAHRAEAMSATSAAMAMYRAALEQVLFGEGFKDGMLAKKIADAATTPPTWWSSLDKGFLDVIKDLGNGAVHANGGDVTKQFALDADTIANVRMTFTYINEIVYERPERDKATLEKLRVAADVVKK